MFSARLLLARLLDLGARRVPGEGKTRFFFFFFFFCLFNKQARDEHGNPGSSIWFSGVCECVGSRQTGLEEGQTFRDIYSGAPKGKVFLDMLREMCQTGLLQVEMESFHYIFGCQYNFVLAIVNIYSASFSTCIGVV